MNRIEYLIALLFVSGMLLAPGCSKKETNKSTARGDVALVHSALKKASKSPDLPTRIALLRFAYENFQTLESKWPDSEKVATFQDEYGEMIGQIPRQVYQFAMQTGDLDAFKWVLDHSSIPLNTQYPELLKYWAMGKDWQDFILSKDPKALSIFMNKAIEENNVKFFNKYVGAFKDAGYQVVFPLEKTEFSARFCRYIADKLSKAMHKGDIERIVFLVDHMPPLTFVVHIDWKTEKTMQELGPYVCMERKDEALACKLVDLGYDMNRIHLAQTGFKPGGPFFQALESHPKYAVAHVLKFNEWEGSLSREEIDFLLTLPTSALRLVDNLYIDEVIEYAVKNVHSEDALRLIQLRAETHPLSLYDYNQLLGWALESNNDTIFNYVRTHNKKINLYSINLDQLAGSPKLFVQYVPIILKRIYPTMETEPKRDGTTYGRIRVLFVNYHPRAALYIVRKYDFGAEWKLATNGRTLLMDVCEGGNFEAARYLVEKRGEDVQAHTGYIEIKTSIMGHNRAREGRLTPMFFAAKGDRDGKLIRYLSSKFGSVNARSGFGTTPLMHAVDSNNLIAAKTLIELGADVNARMNENLTSRELEGMGSYKEISTAYRRALKTGNKAMIQLLKEAGAQP